MRYQASLNSQFPHLGVSVYMPGPSWADEAGAESLARLLVDKRWPWIPWFARFSGKHKRDDVKTIRVGGKNGSEPLRRGLLSDKLARLYMDRSGGDGNFTSVMMNLREAPMTIEQETPYEMLLTCRCSELPVGRVISDFLSLVDDLVQTTRAAHAVIGVWPNFDVAISDTWLTRMVLDTPRGEYLLGVQGRFEEQRSLTSWWKSFFGKRYARHPRWGNYLNDVHLEKIGGVERIAAEVSPAVIRRVGELTYVQLTASVETGMSAEAGAKRDKLEALMAPILPGAGAGSG